jgi:hypothetical protein
MADDDVEEVPDSETTIRDGRKQRQVQTISLVFQWVPAFLPVDPLGQRQRSGRLRRSSRSLLWSIKRLAMKELVESQSS